MIQGTIGDFFDVKGGKRLPKGSSFAASKTQFPYLRVTDFKKNSLDTSDIRYINTDTQKCIKNYTIDSGSVYISIAGTIGLAGIIPDSFDGANLTENAAKFLPKATGQIDSKFFSYYLNSDKVQNIIKSKTMAVGVPKLALFRIKEIPINLPSLAKQQKIAAILDAADSLRQKDQQLIQHYTALSQSLFLEMFGDPVRNPMGWKLQNFGSYITTLTDYHANGSYEVLKENVELKKYKDYALMVRTTDLEKHNFSEDVVYISKEAYNYLSKSKVFGGEIIISKIGSAGKVFLMPKLNIPVSLGMNAFLLRFSKELNDLFAYYLLTSSLGEREIGKRIKGAVTKTIRKDALREIPIIVPPIDVQEQFAQRIEAIEQQKQQAQTNLEKSNALFNSLLQRAFKGELTT